MTNTELTKQLRIRLHRTLPPGSRVLLYGPRAKPPCILIIEPHVPSLIDEALRLRRALRGLPTPLDVRIVDEERARLRAAVRGTVVWRALHEGELLVRT